jgi:hypothetical protein
MPRTTTTTAAAPAPQEPSRKRTAADQAAADGVNLREVRRADARLGVKHQNRKERLAPVTAGGPIKSVQVNPADLASLSAADLAALLAAATTTTAAKTRQPAAARVSLTAEALAAFDAMGWKAPRIDAHKVTEPQTRERLNSCKGAAAYTVAVAALQAGPVSLTDLARLWLASGNEPKAIGAIAQQLANRAGRPILQTGDQLQLTTA